MTREQDFERHLADWLADGPNLAPDQVVDRALAQTAHRRQRRGVRRWLVLPLERVGGRFPTHRAGRLATLAAVLAGVLLASAVVILPVVGGPGSAPVMDDHAPRAVVGSAELVSVTEVTGGSERVLRIETDDPRIRGKARQVLAIEESSENDLVRSSGVMRLENEWGAWDGNVSGVQYPDGTEVEYGWLAGEDAFAGFSYFHSTTNHQAEAERVLEGAIWPDEPPPIPSPSLLQADPLD